MKETSEHTNSYYAASKNWQTDYPKLEGDHHCDVAILGGGFTGVSAALRLIEHGLQGGRGRSEQDQLGCIRKEWRATD